MFKSILKELKNHAPYTFMGALVGIFIVFLLKNLSQDTIFSLFYIFHPSHVFLSAFITASMYKLHKRMRKNPKNDSFLRFFKSDLGSARTHTGCGIAGDMGASRTMEIAREIPNFSASSKENTNIFKIILVGYLGSIGIATLSDSIFPFIGETLLHFPHRELHLGFIEKWYIVNPIAILGILIANRKPFTRLPHSFHVFVSTAASLFHIMMALSGVVNLGIYFSIIFLLFISVWMPCCFSDIVFPLLFTPSDEQS